MLEKHICSKTTTYTARAASSAVLVALMLLVFNASAGCKPSGHSASILLDSSPYPWLPGSAEQDLALPPHMDTSFRTSINVDGKPYTLLLRPYSLRGVGFQVMAIAENHQRLVHVPQSRTFRGEVSEIPKSVVAASLSEKGLRAVIFLPGGDAIWVEPLGHPSSAYKRHVVYRSRDIVPLQGTCGTDASDVLIPPHPLGNSLSGTGTLQGAEIAFDADYEYFQSNGSSVQDTVLDIELSLCAVESIYLQDTDISYELTSILIRSSEPDPYSSNDSGVLLSQFQDEWNTNQSGIVRDVAHLMSGKHLNGSVLGRAFIGAVCFSGYEYGLTAPRTHAMASRVAIAAHELGHNWSAQHCDADPGANCNIMCSVLGSCSGDITSFATPSISAIVQYKDSVDCLSPGEVYVDFSNTTPPFMGTPGDPFNQVVDGVQAVAPLGRVIIRGGVYFEAPVTTARRLTLESFLSPVVIR